MSAKFPRGEQDLFSSKSIDGCPEKSLEFIQQDKSCRINTLHAIDSLQTVWMQIRTVKSELSKPK